jgi:integrase
MATIHLKFKALRNGTSEGLLYFRITVNNEMDTVNTGFRIRQSEWQPKKNVIRLLGSDTERRKTLELVSDYVKWAQRCFYRIIEKYEGYDCSLEDVVEEFRILLTKYLSVFSFMRKEVRRLSEVGRFRSSANCKSSLHRFVEFMDGHDISFSRLDGYLMKSYESYLLKQGLVRNTTSFYMRMLRNIYNKAVELGLTQDKYPFKSVYTGIDKTEKRAISLLDMRRISSLDLSRNSRLEYARDMFLMSFFMRGMSFVDMSYLKKSDLKHGIVRYSRRKTKQTLSLRWETPMMEILQKYRSNTSRYLLPIIQRDGDMLMERNQYITKMAIVNNSLKKIGRMAGIKIPLTMYVSRHSWASIANDRKVSISLISEGMGHNSETTTRIYLASINRSEIDDANKLLINEVYGVGNKR